MDAGFTFQLGREQAGITIAIQQVNERLNTVQAEHQQTRALLEALARAQGLEWSQDVGQWVSTSKLTDLRRVPRESPSA